MATNVEFEESGDANEGTSVSLYLPSFVSGTAIIVGDWRNSAGAGSGYPTRVAPHRAGVDVFGQAMGGAHDEEGDEEDSLSDHSEISSITMDPALKALGEVAVFDPAKQHGVAASDAVTGRLSQTGPHTYFQGHNNSAGNSGKASAADVYGSPTPRSVEAPPANGPGVASAGEGESREAGESSSKPTAVAGSACGLSEALVVTAEQSPFTGSFERSRAAAAFALATAASAAEFAREASIDASGSQESKAAKDDREEFVEAGIECVPQSPPTGAAGDSLRPGADERAADEKERLVGEKERLVGIEGGRRWANHPPGSLSDNMKEAEIREQLVCDSEKEEDKVGEQRAAEAATAAQVSPQDNTAGASNHYVLAAAMATATISAAAPASDDKRPSPTARPSVHNPPSPTPPFTSSDSDGIGSTGTADVMTGVRVLDQRRRSIGIGLGLSTIHESSSGSSQRSDGEDEKSAEQRIIDVGQIQQPSFKSAEQHINDVDQIQQYTLSEQSRASQTPKELLQERVRPCLVIRALVVDDSMVNRRINCKNLLKVVESSSWQKRLGLENVMKYAKESGGSGRSGGEDEALAAAAMAAALTGEGGTDSVSSSFHSTRSRPVLGSAVHKQCELHIDEADDGLAAVDLVHASLRKYDEAPYDVIFIDNIMTVMHGPEATQKIRSLGFSGPIIAITGHVLPEHVAHFLSAGADRVMNKPLDIKELRSVLRGVVRTKAVS